MGKAARHLNHLQNNQRAEHVIWYNSLCKNLIAAGGPKPLNEIDARERDVLYNYFRMGVQGIVQPDMALGVTFKSTTGLGFLDPRIRYEGELIEFRERLLKANGCKYLVYVEEKSDYPSVGKETSMRHTVWSTQLITGVLPSGQRTEPA